MNTISRKVFLGSLTFMASNFALAQEIATAPQLEGGLTASIGTFYVVPSTDDTGYLLLHDATGTVNQIDILSNNNDFEFGYEASLGYIFEDTANGIELFYRGYDHSNTSGPNNGVFDISGTTINNMLNTLDTELNAVDLMISQYLDIGTHMQLRISGGVSYADIQQEQSFSGDIVDGSGIVTDTFAASEKSKFTGWGPRLAMDGRYDFGEDIAGFGIVGGASLAYYLGDTDLTAKGASTSVSPAANKPVEVTQNLNNHAITNLRGNLGIDYVYFFDNDEQSTLGLELGYMVDYYADAVSNYSNVAAIASTSSENSSPVATLNSTTGPLTFSGPYVELKGVF